MNHWNDWINRPATTSATRIINRGSIEPEPMRINQVTNRQGGSGSVRKRPTSPTPTPTPPPPPFEFQWRRPSLFLSEFKFFIPTYWCVFIGLLLLLRFTVASYDGEVLSFHKITRSEMGAYLCIANNGVPPSVSRRVVVNVHCKNSKQKSRKFLSISFNFFQFLSMIELAWLSPTWLMTE